MQYHYQPRQAFTIQVPTYTCSGQCPEIRNCFGPIYTLPSSNRRFHCSTDKVHFINFNSGVKSFMVASPRSYPWLVSLIIPNHRYPLLDVGPIQYRIALKIKMVTRMISSASCPTYRAFTLPSESCDRCDRLFVCAPVASNKCNNASAACTYQSHWRHQAPCIGT